MARKPGINADAPNSEAIATNDKAALVKAVQTPLGSYVLCVLVVEALIGVVGLHDSQHMFAIALLMSAVILILIATVTFLGYNRPESLFAKRPNNLVVLPATKANSIVSKPAMLV